MRASTRLATSASDGIAFAPVIFISSIIQYLLLVTPCSDPEGGFALYEPAILPPG